ncbi:Transcription factor [Friedmanniomyces endolithicus]|uniref:Transcription factor n=1 Tax=Friedmanniomyces endolithicus TaxID=329885 RepID=A0AAN6KLL9_9PEZI|nr:Transcription factor [Friedmanniomyces endolithicus]KAK0789025.1 Transcription factor [Friedmanniomyces endolithicus]KAK0801606.1 Transcription factor [Friedmanniomyces endolithicus]KAK0807333.1 Transcription factor [Friedmanniomyces endolithicus]KAK0864511.1 Transcription factor [Friedmanniomyces endolithicus]
MSTPAGADPSSAMNNDKSGSRLSDQQKKKNHILSEAKRREAIRAEFDRLATLVPGMEGQGRSEAVVLQATVEFMREQVGRKEELRNEARRAGMSEEEFESCYSAAQGRRSIGGGEDGRAGI